MKKPKFKVGDSIRVISIPQSVLQMRPSKWRDGETGLLTIFRRLVKTNRARRVAYVDNARGWPWIDIDIRSRSGVLEHLRLQVEPECVRPVRKRR